MIINTQMGQDFKDNFNECVKSRTQRVESIVYTNMANPRSNLMWM